MLQVKNGQVAVGDSLMDYACFGQGKKVLIVLPGLSDGLATVKGKALLLFSPYRRHLKDYTVYMFSRKRDLGKDSTIWQMARDQAEALKNLGIHKASVLGVSQGGMIAQALAILEESLVDKLVLAVTAPWCTEMARGCLEHWMALAREGKHGDLMRNTAEKSYSPEYLKKYRKYYPFLGLVAKPKNYDRFEANVEAISGFDARKDIGNISIPTFILGGEKDQIVGAEGSFELARLIPGSSLYMYPGLGHAAYEEAGDFYERVFAFLDGQSE